MDTIDNSRPATLPMFSVASGQASTEAMMRSNQTCAAGCKMIGEIMAETAKCHYDQSALAWQAMSRVKTWKDAVELQTEYVRGTTEHSFDGAKKLVEATNKLTHDAVIRVVDRVASVSPLSGAVG